jgi:uncharacterized membrane protein YeaQ/YmgE (transglycosylase-associated protein family)
MNGLDSVLGWMAIGAAASLVAMMWPFLRGSGGVIAKLIVGPLGAVVGALLSHWAFPHEPPEERLTFAALGAIIALLLVQVFWTRYARARMPVAT